MDSIYEFSYLNNELSVNLEEIMIPIRDCMSVEIGPIKKGIITKLENSNFGQAPVLVKNGVLGLISLEKLKNLFESNEPLLEKDSAIQLNEIFPRSSLLSLIDFLKEYSAGLVCDEFDGQEYGTHYAVLGLITVSDLDKHYIRTKIFILLSRLEIMLEKFIKRNCSNCFDCINNMSVDSRIRILRYWEFSKKRNIEISPLEACTLSDMLNIVYKNENLCNLLGYSSKNKFNEIKGSIPELRNSIMHPVRPLIAKPLDLEDLKKTLISIVELINKIEFVEK
jgi:predicted transcriptional regulator